MKRGDIWTVASGTDHAGKPRPVVVVQDARFDTTGSAVVCVFATNQTEGPLFRLPVSPTEENGLRVACRLMVDKISAVPRRKVGTRLGRVDDETLSRLNKMLVFLGLAVSPRSNEGD